MYLKYSVQHFPPFLKITIFHSSYRGQEEVGEKNEEK